MEISQSSFLNAAVISIEHNICTENHTKCNMITDMCYISAVAELLVTFDVMQWTDLAADTFLSAL